MSRTRYIRRGREGAGYVSRARPAPSEPEARSEPAPDKPLTAEEMAASLAEDDEFVAMVRADLRARWAR